MPNFFANNPDELRALIKQSAQSEYGGLESNLRESLAGAGVLSPGSMTDALTKGSIALGQETLGKFSDIGLQELDRARALQSQDYLIRLENSLGSEDKTNQNIFEAAGAFGAGIGSMFGQKGGVKPEEEEDPLDQILNSSAVKKKKKYKPEDSALEGGYA